MSSVDVASELESFRAAAREKAKSKYLTLLAKPKLSEGETRELSELADRFGRTPGDVRADIERLAEEAKSKAAAETIQTITAELAEAQAKADALIEKLNAERARIDGQEADALGAVEFLKHKVKTAQSAQRRLADIGREWRQCFGEHTPEPVLKTTHGGGNPYEMQPFAR